MSERQFNRGDRRPKSVLHEAFQRADQESMSTAMGRLLLDGITDFLGQFDNAVVRANASVFRPRLVAAAAALPDVGGGRGQVPAHGVEWPAQIGTNDPNLESAHNDVAHRAHHP